MPQALYSAHTTVDGYATMADDVPMRFLTPVLFPGIIRANEHSRPQVSEHVKVLYLR